MADLDLIVFTYQEEDQAVAALHQVVTAKQENTREPLVAVDDAAVASKDATGKVTVRQTLESAVKGSRVAGGGFWGLLVGFLFGGPLLGALIGMGLRAFGNKHIDIGIDNSFITEVSDALAPGQSVLFLLTAATSPDRINTALGDHGGTLYHTSLASDAATVLTDLAEDETITTALEADDG